MARNCGILDAVKIRIVFLVILIWGLRLAFAGPDDDEKMGRPTFEKNGQFFTVQLSPEAKRIDVKVAGNPVAAVEPNDYRVFGRVHPRTGPQRALTLSKHEDHFHFQDQLRPEDQIEIQIQSGKGLKSETFLFDNLKMPPSRTPTPRAPGH